MNIVVGENGWVDGECINNGVEDILKVVRRRCSETIKLLSGQGGGH
jgi:hypothetical protein